MQKAIRYIKKLFNVKEKPVFTIEYYPLTKRYYPKYKEYYLSISNSTGFVELVKPYLIMYARYGENEQRADEIIDLFKEQNFKENVKTIIR